MQKGTNSYGIEKRGKMIKFKKIEHDIRPLLSELPRVFEKHAEIVAAYLFGSYAHDKVDPLSDVDIALLSDPPYNRKINFEQWGNYHEEVVRSLKTEEVDLIILNEAPLRIQYGILANKELIYNRDNDKRVDFEVMVYSHYFDFKHLLDEYYDSLFLRIKNESQKIP